MKRIDDFEYKLKIVPKSSGCYLYYNAQSEIIYIGKAKNLNKRINSYFNRANNSKTTLLVNDIYDFEYIITTNERESLILELNLIKKHLPYYNIKLTDNSGYPYIELTNEANPRLLISFHPKKTSDKFGPYPNSYSANQVLKLLNRIYPLRKCKKVPKEVCLYYQMNQCLAPCIKKVDKKEYQDIKLKIRKFLKGDTKEVIASLKNKMQEASEALLFERAKEYKELINDIEVTTKKQLINDNKFSDRDILTYQFDESKVAIALFMVRDGKMIARDVHLFDITDTPKLIFDSFVLQYYYDYNILLPSEIILSEAVEGIEELVNSTITVPKIGDKLKNIEMAKMNAKNKLEEHKLLVKRQIDVTVNANEILRKILNLEKLEVIEIFDNSSNNGVDAVSAMVSYKNAQKDPNNYRKYIVKTVEGLDDYKTMKEVIYRRYFRLLVEGASFPDLIIVDGGKIQVKAANEVLEELNINIKVIGLVKDNKHKTRGIIDKDYQEITIDDKNLYTYLVAMQEEVHRYAINFHRTKQQKSYKKSILDQISGIGDKRKVLLLKNFDSIDDLKRASVEDIVNLGIPKKVALSLLKELEGLK